MTRKPIAVRRAIGIVILAAGYAVPSITHGDASEPGYAEAFELCEYGRQPSREELMELFPFFGSE